MAEAGSGRRETRNDAARLLLAAARERFSVAATDLLLPEQARLSEWQRLTAANLLAVLVRSIEDELRLRLAERFRLHEPLNAALSSARVPIAGPILDRAQALRDPELTTLLVRRAEEHRFWEAREAGRKEWLHELVRDEDAAIAADAMELVIARSRRFDGFGDPALGRAELPAELQHHLVWLVAAALRHYIVQQHHLAAVDGAIEAAANEIIGSYDEGQGFEALSVRLARRLHATGRLDGRMLVRILDDGMLPLFIASLALLCGLDPTATWEVLSDPRGRGPALLLRAAAIERDEAASVLLALNMRGPLLSGAEGETTIEQLELFDTVDPASAQDVLRLWKANPAYRACVARLSTRSRRPAEAA